MQSQEPELPGGDANAALEERVAQLEKRVAHLEREMEAIAKMEQALPRLLKRKPSDES